MSTITPDDIRELREQRELSQSQLARALGMSKRTVQQWEQGLRQPGDRVAQRLLAMMSPAKQRRARVVGAIETAALRAEEADRDDLATELRNMLARFMTH